MEDVNYIKATGRLMFLCILKTAIHVNRLYTSINQRLTSASKVLVGSSSLRFQ